MRGENASQRHCSFSTKGSFPFAKTAQGQDDNLNLEYACHSERFYREESAISREFRSPTNFDK